VSVERGKLEVTSAEELRAWLLEHHADSTGIWLVTWRKGRGPYVPYPDRVVEALCFGWIDSLAGKVDDDRSMLLLTPRKPGSGWSRVNKGRIERILAEGPMHPAGQAVLDRAVADGSWTALDAVEALTEPEDLRVALDADPGARRSWDGFLARCVEASCCGAPRPGHSRPGTGGSPRP